MKRPKERRFVEVRPRQEEYLIKTSGWSDQILILTVFFLNLNFENIFLKNKIKIYILKENKYIYINIYIWKK